MVGQRVQRIEAALHELAVGGGDAAVVRNGAGPIASVIDQDDIDARFKDAAEK